MAPADQTSAEGLVLKVICCLLVVFSLFWVTDAVFRWLEAFLARKLPKSDGDPVSSLVILVPARREGCQVRPTLESLVAARKACQIQSFLILDGTDPQARAVAEELGITVVEKNPAGPTKAAALRFAAGVLGNVIKASEGVMILDVGSKVIPDFFINLRWPRHAAAVQAPLRAKASGPGEGAALSEYIAQQLWDRGKEGMGWGVKLRGTGTLFRPEVFLAVVPQLHTQIEDTEASFLLAAQGWRTALLPAVAVVIDEKPFSVAEASRQRARWLAGQWSVIRCHWRKFLPFFARRPLEALSWAAMLLSRPLSLTTPLRLIVGVFLFTAGQKTGPFVLVLWGLLAAASAIAEVMWLMLAHPRSLWPVLQLAWSWIRALSLVPKAWSHWHRGRREKA